MWHVTFLKYFILDPLSLTFILGGFIHSVLFLWNKWLLSSTFHYSLISFSCSKLNDSKPFKLYLIWHLCLSEATSFVRLACSKGTAINVQIRRGDEAENLSIGYFRLTNWDSSGMKNHFRSVNANCEAFSSTSAQNVPLVHHNSVTYFWPCPEPLAAVTTPHQRLCFIPTWDKNEVTISIRWLQAFLS